jgi:hypothetical protein
MHAVLTVHHTASRYGEGWLAGVGIGCVTRSLPSQLFASAV